MNEHTYAEWVLQGIGGVVNMMKALAESDVKITKAQREQLAKRAAELADYHKRFDKRVSDE